MHVTQVRAGEGTLVHAAALVADARADLDRLSAGLDQQVLAARTSWQGAGGAAFFALHQAWTDRQRVVVAALDRFHAELVGTDAALAAADDGAHAAATATLQRLGGLR